MKSLVVCFGLLAGSLSFAASPYAISVDKLITILRHESLQSEVFDAIESIEFIKHNRVKGVSSYLFATSKCKYVVRVRAEFDSLTPDWKVLDVDSSGCWRH